MTSTLFSMKTFALACTAAVAMGLGIGDATSPPETVDVSIFLCILNAISRNLAVLQTNLAACGHMIWTTATLTISFRALTASRCKFGWKSSKTEHQASSSMDSSLFHSSFRTSTSPLTSLVTRCHLTESKFFTQQVLLVFSNSWVLEIIHSLDLSEELIMVSTEFLRSAPSPPTSFPQLLQVSSSSEMELMQETASLFMLLKAIPGPSTSWSQFITLMLPYLKTGVIWWHPMPSFPKCLSTLETCL